MEPRVKVDPPPQPVLLSQPDFDGSELTYLARAIDSRRIAGDGPFSRECEQLLERELRVPHVLLTSSGTHALEMAALLLDVGPEDEVIAPSFTLSSTVNAFILRGATPRFIDVRPDTLNIDENLIEAAITARTKAIVIVHYAGIACEMDAIMALSSRYNIPIVEDNAHGLFATYRERYLGTFGVLAMLSFHETKNFTCGEGGALIVNDPQYAPRAEILREKGTDRTQFYLGLVDKYTWIDVGSSYAMSDLLASVLLSQLERRATIQGKLTELWWRYWDGLKDATRAAGIAVPTVPEGCQPSAHLFYVLARDDRDRADLMEWLKRQGIATAFHFMPLHASKMGRSFGYAAGDLPITESVSQRLLRLPLHTGLTTDQQDRVIDAICEYCASRA